MKKTIASILIGLLLSGVVLWVLVTTIDTAPVWATLHNMSLDFFMVSLLFAASTQTLRAWRLAILLRRPLSWQLVSIIARHQFWANLLPLRTGEAALPLFLKVAYQVPLLHGGLTLVVLRLYDLGVIVAMGGLVAGLTLWAEDWFAAYAPLVLLCGGVALVCLLAAPALARLCARLPWPQKLAALLEGLGTLTPENQRGILISTVCIWGSVFMAYACAFMAVGLFPSVSETMISGAAGALAFALPLNGIAGVGPFQAAVTSTLTAVAHVPASAAFAAALAAHMSVFLATAVQALVSTLYPIRSRL